MARRTLRNSSSEGVDVFSPEDARRRSLPSTRGSVRLLPGGRVEETPVCADRQAVEDADLTAIFLSGNVSTWVKEHEAEAAVPGAKEEQLSFFPDPPCVLPCRETEEEESELGVQAFRYWKEYAGCLEGFPQVQESQQRCRDFLQSIGKGHVRVSSVAVFRIFVNVSMATVGVRSIRSLAEDAKTGELVHPGQAIAVKDRAVEKDGARWWRLRDVDGFVFDAREGRQLLVEAMNVETGHWWYRVCCEECVEVRVTPTYSAKARSGWIMVPGEVAVVCMRCRLAGSEFVQLADGRGWVFTKKPFEGDKGTVCEGQEPVLEECEADFWEENVPLDVPSVPPTNEVVEVGNWTYVVQQRPVLCIGVRRNGTFLAPGDIVKVDKRCIANGDPFPGKSVLNRTWARLKDGRGWVPLFTEDGKEALRLQELGNCSYPAWYRGRAEGNLDRPDEEWMVGFV